MAYLKNAQNGILLALGGALADDPLCFERVDEIFEEAHGNLLVVKGADFRFGAFELVTYGTCPLSSCKPGGR